MNYSHTFTLKNIFNNFYDLNPEYMCVQGKLYSIFKKGLMTQLSH